MNNRRTAARTFVRHYATKEDMENLIEIFNNENPNAKLQLMFQKIVKLLIVYFTIKYIIYA